MLLLFLSFFSSRPRLIYHPYQPSKSFQNQVLLFQSCHLSLILTFSKIFLVHLSCGVRRNVINRRYFFAFFPILDIWSDKARVAYYLRWEVALAKVQSQLKIIPEEAYQEIASKAKVEHIDWDKLKEKTELIGYPVLGVVQQIVSLCRDGLGEWCHWGATTQDVTDSATVMAIRDSFQIIEADLEHIMGSVAQLAENHRSTPSKFFLSCPWNVADRLL